MFFQSVGSVRFGNRFAPLTLLLCLGFALPALAQTAPQPVAVPLGITDLLVDPQCTVGYQRFGEEPHILGWRWTGYDPDSGVYFTPEPRDENRQQVFMHSPWTKGPGVTFADFPLQLPQTTHIQLDLSTALRASAKDSDGVTYRVIVDGTKLWEEFGDWRSWRDFQVDLTPYAGKTVTLRLEVDPGPKRNSTDDWSLWGKAEIVAGTEAEVKAAVAKQEKERAAKRRADFAIGARLADADLTQFSRGNATRTSWSDSARPNTAGPVENRLTRDGDAFLFTCRAADETVEYRFAPSQGLFDGISVRVNGIILDPAPFIGAVRVLLNGHEFVAGSAALTCRLVSAEVKDSSLVCRYEYRTAGSDDVAVLDARLRAEGKSFVISLDGTPNKFTGFSLGTAGGPVVATPFATGGAPRYHRQGEYISAFADLWQSNASAVGSSGATYAPLTDGTRRTLHDTCYLTVSDRYEETLANVPHSPSPFLQDLSHRVVLDGWGGSFADNDTWLHQMARYGIDHFLMIKHVWQRDGYDHSYPDTMPANAALGGDAGLRRLSLDAQALGHRFCVHENYYDYYPNAEDFHKEDCSLHADGSTIAGWNNGTVVARILKPSKLMDYVRRFTPEIHRRYSCDAAYHDIMPTWHEDYDAKVANSGMIRQTHEYTKQLCDYDRQLFGGPVVFEAADPMMAGIYDGGCNHGVDTYKTPTQPAFELLKVHPKMSNHGFGYYERWLPWGYGSGWYNYVMTDRELDHYRATEVAFGRTGFIGQQLMQHPHGVVREYYLMQAFARAYTGQPLVHLAYYVEDGGWSGWLDAGTAARYQRYDRIRAIYPGGQQVYSNLSDKPWTVEGHTLPAYGTLTVGPRSTAYTATLQGQIADFSTYGDTTYADARSQQWLPAEPAPPIKPTLGAWKDNGDGSFTMTVNWQVGRTLDRDFTAFWHFKDGDRILFQSDHAPATKTTAWRDGQTVQDGPIRIAVHGDQTVTTYDVVVGLYDKNGRAPLVANADEMRIAQLHVTRDGDRVTAVKLEAVATPPQPGSTREPYLEGANTAHKVIDFGPVATNGAVVMRKQNNSLTIIPVPIGTKMNVGVTGALTRATAYDENGKALPRLAVKKSAGKLWFDIPVEAVGVEVE